jgi:hypothetical protein
MIELRSAFFPDVVGLILRSFLECWYLGMYFVLAPEDAYEATHAAHADQLAHLDPTVWTGADEIAAQMANSQRRMNWRDVSARVGDLLDSRGYSGVREATDALYKTLYQGESAMSVHAGAGTLTGHFVEASHERFDLSEIPTEPDDGALRIQVAAPLLETLARAVCGTFGIGYGEIDRLAKLFPS